ncbi:cytochrome P450 [Pseudovirgaria hyperparasitica]|uniref:Cytochrome P450 n=1 Tax=Pseudovirgaria hyperparasitica TaxID=470096 RepID=A0A6A6WMF6_9PEZI|nr:cytochrome P450 [Pseudovirgaria hyperparasitica]KAF2763385.1 cytochrome P450 [Pseudovirgaria hyperparasitica]
MMPTPSILVVALCALILYLCHCIRYNWYSSPLARLPGPPLWSVSRLPFILSLWRGRLVYDVFDMHKKYGDVVRIAPDEVSFASGEAWKDIYCRRPGHQPFLKNPIWWGEMAGRAESIVSVPSWDGHEKHRKMISHCFSDRALNDEESLVQAHVNLLINTLCAKVEESPTMTAMVNMVDWYSFTTFDIIGELCFGDREAFGCLKNSNYHPWIKQIATYFKYGSLMATIRFYPLLANIVHRCIPRHVYDAQEKNYQWAVRKVRERLNSDTPQRDFMSTISPYLKGFGGARDESGISMAELESNFYVLVNAGSSTCTTVLCGATSYLMKSPEAMLTLRKELRARFKNTSEMTFSKLANLPYLNAVIEESLRLAPPVGGALSHVVPPGGDTVCGIWLPGGTQVGVHQWSAFRNPLKFHNADAFKPERWLAEIKTENSPFLSDDRETVSAFSVGSWMCIGKNLAMAELRLIISRMVWRFNIAEGRNKVIWSEQKQYVQMELDNLEVELSMLEE